MLNLFVQNFKRFLNKFKTTDYEIISLAPNCYPKTLLTRKKLKKYKAEGEKTMPFDLAWYKSAEFITEFIQNDFLNFFEDMKYSQIAQSWDASFKINFSHEKNFKENDLEKLIDMYNQRITNFRNVMASEKPILFIQVLKDKEIGEDISNLYEVIKARRAGKPFELLIIDTNDIVKDPVQNVSVIKIFQNLDNENIYKPEFYKSKEGKAFEKKILEQIKSVLKNKLKKNLVKFF